MSNNLKIIVVDIETNGSEPPASVIEFGAVSLSIWDSGPPPPSEDWDASERVSFGEEKFSSLYGLADGEEVDLEALATHHIPPSLVRDLDPYDNEPLVIKFSGYSAVAAHNADFEKKWVRLDLPWICTYKCALRVWPDAPRHSNQFLRYFLGIEPSNLGDFDPPHRALPDAEVTARILGKLLEDHSLEQLLEWSSEPRYIKRMPFGKHRGELLSEVPFSYLSWLSGPGFDGDEDVKFNARKEIERREGNKV